MSKLTEQGVRKVESKLEGADSNPVRVLIRPDLTREEGQALARSLPSVDERGRPRINVVIAGDDALL